MLTLRVDDGRLTTRLFKCPCTIAAESEGDEDARRRAHNIEKAAQLLSAYGLTERDVEQLVEKADARKASLWSPLTSGRPFMENRAICGRHELEPSAAETERQ